MTPEQIADAIIQDGYGDLATFQFALDMEPIDAGTIRRLLVKAARLGKAER